VFWAFVTFASLSLFLPAGGAWAKTSGSDSPSHIFAAAIATLATGSYCEHEAKAFHCVKFKTCHDADTFSVEIPKVHPFFGQNAHIRVDGVDAPELHGVGPCEAEVSDFARVAVEKELKGARRIDLLNVRPDKYFRIVADVRYDGHSLGEFLLKRGLAYPYFGKTKEKRSWCGVLKSLKDRHD
jgi:endonuclease YncB( thermonuclease family)